MANVNAASTAVLNLEFRIEASQTRVWECITQETTMWWDKDFVSMEGSTGVILEPFVGGRVYEQIADQKGLEWCRVVAISAPDWIEFVGQMTPTWSGPTITMVRFELTPDAEATVLKLTEGLVGRVTDEVVASMEQGWTFLIGTKLKEYAEKVATAV